MEAVLDTFDQNADVHWSVFPNPPACPKLSADVRPISKQNWSFLAKKTGSQSDSKGFLATKMHVSDQDDVCSKKNIYPLFVLKWQTVRISCSLLLDENLFLFGHWGKNRPEYLCIVIFLFCILAKATVQNLIFKTLEYWSTYYSEYSPQKHMSSCSQLPPVTSIFFCPFLKVGSAIVPIIILVLVLGRPCLIMKFVPTCSS